VSHAQAARDMNIPRTRLCDIFAQRRNFSTDTALRIERYLGISGELLLKAQTHFEYEKAKKEKSKMIRDEVTLLGA
jgi:addiction module HigA family antidote